MIDLSMQDLTHVKVLAQIEADKTGKNQVIINSYNGRYKVFRFLRQDQWDGQIVATVRYTKKDTGGNILRDNGNGKPEPVKSKAGAKSKRGKAE